MELSQQQIETFFATGYLIIDELFAPREVAMMDGALQQLEATAKTLDSPAVIDGAKFVVERINPDDTTASAGRPSHRIHRIQWAGAAAPILAEFGAAPRMLQIASQLLGSPGLDLDQIINQVHFKFPFDGVAFPWHQDSQFRRYGTDLWHDHNGRGSFVQIAVAVDAMTPDNGPLQFIPGSCQWGHLGLDKLAKAARERKNGKQDSDNHTLTVDYALPEEVRDRCRVEDAVSMSLAPGSAVVFGPYTIHRSLPNEGKTPRRIFINGYAYPGANRREYPGAGVGKRLRYLPEGVD